MRPRKICAGPARPACRSARPCRSPNRGCGTTAASPTARRRARHPRQVGGRRGRRPHGHHLAPRALDGERRTRQPPRLARWRPPADPSALPPQQFHSTVNDEILENMDALTIFTIVVVVSSLRASTSPSPTPGCPRTTARPSSGSARRAGRRRRGRRRAARGSSRTPAGCEWGRGRRARWRDVNDVCEYCCGSG